MFPCSPVMHSFGRLNSNTYDSGAASSILDYYPDKFKFTSFFNDAVGAAGVISKAEFISYEDMVSLLEDRLIFSKRVDDMWTSRVGDLIGLNCDDAYSLLCQLIDSTSPDDLQMQRGEFNSISGGKDTLTFSEYISSSDIKDMLVEDFVNVAELAEIWKFVSKTDSVNNSIEILLTGQLNKVLLLAMNKRMNSPNFQ